MKKYRLVKYDVWGNDEDGYEVNDIYQTDTILRFKGFPTDGQIIKALQKYAYNNMRSSDVDFPGMGDETIIYIDFDGRPLCELRLED